MQWLIYKLKGLTRLVFFFILLAVLIPTEIVVGILVVTFPLDYFVVFLYLKWQMYLVHQEKR